MTADIGTERNHAQADIVSELELLAATHGDKAGTIARAIDQIRRLTARIEWRPPDSDRRRVFSGAGVDLKHRGTAMNDIPKNRPRVSVDLVAFLSSWASIMQDSAHNDHNRERREIARTNEAEFREALKQAEADADELEALRARVAELEKANGEPVAYLHQVVCGDGEPDQALSFAPDNFQLSGVLGYRSLSHVPLYTAPPAPRVDVDAISDEAIKRGMRAFEIRLDMRAALRAIFNKGE